MKVFNVNGYKVLFHKNANSEIVNIRICTNVGSSMESPEQYGIAHFLEHMMFKGTPTRTAKEINCEAESFGGSLNAYTSFDATVYHITALRKYFDNSFDLLSDLFLNPTMPEDELEKERGVVLDEIARSVDDPDDYLYRKIAKDLVPNGIGHPILGDKDVIKNVTKEELLKFKDDYYCGENLLISVVGNLEDDEVVAAAERHFKDFKEAKRVETSINPIKTGTKQVFKKAGITETYYDIYYPGLPRFHEDEMKLKIMLYVLGGSSSAYLFETIREDLGLCYGIYGFSFASDHFNTIEIGTSANGENIPLIHEKTMEIIEMMKNKKVPQERLDRAKVKVLSRIEMGLESSSGYNAMIATRVLKGEKGDPIENTRKAIEAVTLEDVQEMAQKVFATDPYISILEPEDKEELPSTRPEDAAPIAKPELLKKTESPEE